MISEIKISRHDKELIQKEREVNSPHLACGVLIGTIKDDIAHVEKALPITNVKGTTRTDFELDPKEHYNAWVDAEKNGNEIVGIYHSNPVSSAVPSLWDRDTMEKIPSVWLIAGVDGMRAFFWENGIKTVKITEILKSQSLYKKEKKEKELPSSSRPLRVFLCHSSHDKPCVRGLYRKLLDDGFDPWLDEEKLLPGQNWQMEISRAVRTSDVIIVCLSPKAINKSGYVQKEIKYALDIADEQPEDKIFLIPLKLEECDVPERLHRWQWAELFKENGYERLMRAIRIVQSYGDEVHEDAEKRERERKTEKP